MCSSAPTLDSPTNVPGAEVGPAQSGLRAPATRLFVLSFAALFLELMVIRWAPSEVRLVAYYANLMLVSSFLGLGLGAMLRPREWRLFRWFPPLLAGNVIFLITVSSIAVPVAGEARFYGSVGSPLFAYVTLCLVFLLNAVVFVPLGEEIAAQFLRLPPLRAYVWDLAGSLAGTLAFGAFSLLHFSPVLGIGAVAVLVFLLNSGTARWSGALFGAIAVTAVAWSGRAEPAWWSPYYHITLREKYARDERQPGTAQGVAWWEERKVDAPPADLRTRRDPPFYAVRVNQDFYQMHGTIDARRYTPGSPLQQLTAGHFLLYDLPYRIVPPPKRVLVLGAGGGVDVEAALLRGAERVDAVEIDPVIAQLSDRYNAAAPYRQPQVVVHVDDARAFLERTREHYDLVVFGHLDSQALFSYGASVRLDGFIYTVESFRRAYSRLTPTGALAISFTIVNEWLAQKFAQMLEAATGAPPLVYVGKGTVTFIAARIPVANPPAAIGEWKLRRAAPQPVDLATDDWPFLYLQRRGIPTDYAIVIGTLLAVSLATLFALRGRGFGRTDAHFLFLGWGFLLLQTKSIGDCSLYFGATWLVTMLVITGVLLMVMLANFVALGPAREFRLWFYLPLFASLLVLLLVPRDWVLAQPLAARIAWTLVVVPLPVFFAGLVFSTTFAAAPHPALALGANLMGATLGGFCEYLGMRVGSQALGYVILAVYAASLLCQWRAARPHAAAPTPG